MTTPSYSRTNPSPRYRQLLGYYQQMHLNGDAAANIDAGKMFDGRSLAPQAAKVKLLVDRHQARSILDYGAGKAGLYKASPISLPDGSQFQNLQAWWGVERITLYDPAYAPLSTLPDGKFDGVISTDVLEHCPEEDMSWIVGEMFAYADMFVFANIASYPAQKRLPSGENAHITIRPPSWWAALFKEIGQRYPSIRWYATVEEIGTGPDGQPVLKEQLLTG